jgi:transcriptional regulator with XRE-family HTH domain
MPAATTPTARMRHLGSELRKLREATGKTQEQVAELVELSPATVYRIENGRHAIKQRDLQKLLDLYEPKPEVRGNLEETAKRARERGWWAVAPYAGVHSPAFTFYISMENDATNIRRWLTTGIHGLLQTPEYARAVEIRGNDPEPLIEQRLAMRAIRQQRALDPARDVRLWTIMDESVLRRVYGSPEIMADQMDHLKRLVERPNNNLTLQILPFSSGLPFMAGHDFTIFDLGQEDQIVSADGPFGVTHFDQGPQVATISLQFGALTESALSPRASIELIDATAKEYRNGSSTRR